MTDKRIILTPAEYATLGAETAKNLNARRDRLAPILLPGLDDYFHPLEPGTLTVVQAQTHNGKSLFMKLWKHRLMHHIMARDPDDVIVWVDTETPANYLALNQVASGAGMTYREIINKRGLDTAALFRSATKVSEQPVFTIASRLGEANEDEIHLTNIRKGIDMLVRGEIDGRKRRVAAIFIDYLQELPIDPVVAKERDMDKQRRLQVKRDVNVCRQMGARFDCPIILGVQAKQTPAPTEMMRELAIPGSAYDGEETAGIGQRADRIIALSVPERTFGRGKVLNYHGKNLKVEPGLLLVAVLKQRGFDNAGAVFAYQITSGSDLSQSLAHVWSEA